jgi:hypothetical protein
MELQLKIIGILLIGIGIFHITFPKQFNWKTEFASLSLISRQMMYVHTFFIGLTVLLMGVLCLISSVQLIETDLGKKVCLGFGIFWAIRLFIQFFGYSSKLWKGKTFETVVHIVFSFLWVYLSYVFLIIALK